MKCIVMNILMVCACLSSCGHSPIFKLEADVHTDEYDGLYIYLTHTGVVSREDDRKVDSALIRNGHFSFEYRVTGEPFVATLALPPKDDHFVYGLPDCYCIVEEGNVTLDYTPLGTQLKGGILNQQYDNRILAKTREIKKRNNSIVAERDSLGKLRTLSIEEMEAFNQRIGALYKELQPAHICFVSDYIGTEVGAFFFFYYPESYYPEGIYAKLLASVDEEYRHKSELKKEKEKEAAAHWNESVKITEVGYPYRDFTCMDIEGKEVNLSDYIHSGRVTLVDFWASWCVPCVQELPFLKSLYQTYHEEGLDIVSVSLDTKRSAWEAAVKKHQIPWPQISDLKGWKGTITKDYAISAIPFILVIDRKGKIAVRNLHDYKLEEAIKEILSTKN
ncbi:TlpA disulfide reductase family protein [Bacteroides acidifaciens]|uniref:AhpC/TSA family protein n=1 Tax=Bacteroides acidifaciens TaxID=85831 RepID=A0A4S2AQA3_9BACE|nr:TlpA disulfide reductase family protein [Bacteroides acidifaciens]TGY03032.1 AhpC/TSA family protein [Bacteroides acidifaciens]